MTKFYFLLIAFFCGAVSHTYAQKNQQAGYVILTDGQRIEGFIEYKDREFNPREVVFSSSQEGATTTYLPLELQSFEVAGERFVSAIVDTESSPRKTNELTYDKDLKIDLDTAFLRVIVQGPQSLYHLRNKARIDNFYIGEGDGFTLLKYKRYLAKNKQGNPAIKENTAFASQLEQYLKACPDRMSLIMGSEYNLSDLEDLFLDFYDCQSADFDFHRSRKKVKVQLGILAGLTGTKVNINSSGPNLDAISFPMSYAFTGGFYVDAIIPRNQYRWSFLNEIMWSSYNTGVDYTGTVPAVFFPTGRTDLEYGYLTWNFMMRHRIPVGQVNLFVNAGIANGFAVIAEDNEDILVPIKRRHEQSLLAGMGAEYGRFSLEARYQRGNGFSSISGLTTPADRFHILGGFRF